MEENGKDLLNVSIAMDKYERRPSNWFRDSFGLLGKYGTISKDQFIRASIDIGVSFLFPFACEASIIYSMKALRVYSC